jgi:predicted Na+-dependent transporter
LISWAIAPCLSVPSWRIASILAIGFLLVRIFPLTPDASVGILLLAAIPGTPIALQFTRQAKTRLAFAAAMTFVLSLVSVAMAPLAVEVMPQTAQRNQRPILLLMMSIVLYIGLPLCAGLWAARHAPKIAPRLVLPLGVLATVAFLYLSGRRAWCGVRPLIQSAAAGPSWRCSCCCLCPC